MSDTRNEIEKRRPHWGKSEWMDFAALQTDEVKRLQSRIEELEAALRWEAGEDTCGSSEYTWSNKICLQRIPESPDFWCRACRINSVLAAQELEHVECRCGDPLCPDGPNHKAQEQDTGKPASANLLTRYWRKAMFERIEREIEWLEPMLPVDGGTKSVAQSMRLLLDVAKAADKAKPYVRGTNYYDSLVDLRDVLTALQEHNDANT